MPRGFILLLGLKLPQNAQNHPEVFEFKKEKKDAFMFYARKKKVEKSGTLKYVHVKVIKMNKHSKQTPWRNRLRKNGQ